MKVEVTIELEVDLLDISVRDVKKIVNDLVSTDKPDAIKSMEIKNVKLNP